eukprot:UN16214
MYRNNFEQPFASLFQSLVFSLRIFFHSSSNILCVSLFFFLCLYNSLCVSLSCLRKCLLHPCICPLKLPTK